MCCNFGRGGGVGVFHCLLMFERYEEAWARVKCIESGREDGTRGDVY